MRGVQFCDRLFALEDEFAKLPSDDNSKARYEARLEKSKPVMEEFYAWCKSLDVMPCASMGKAVGYVQEQRFWLEHFLLDGRLEISNNVPKTPSGHSRQAEKTGCSPIPKKARKPVPSFSASSKPPRQTGSTPSTIWPMHLRPLQTTISAAT